MTTVSDHTDGCAKHYHWEPAIYLIPCLALECSIIIYRLVRAPGHGKYVVDGMNSRDKHMLKLAIANLLNPELF